MTSELGLLRLAAGVLHHERDRRCWTLPVSDLVLVGEFTTASEPLAEDYFFVFIGPRGAVHLASFYAEGRVEVLASLGAVLGTELRAGLHDSAGWRSRVLWPPDLAGAPLFEFVSPPSTSLKTRALRALGLERQHAVLAEAVRERLGVRYIVVK